MSSSNAVQNLNTQAVTTTVPTVVVSSTPVAENQPGGNGILVSGMVQVTPGTAATAVTLKVVIGTLAAGTQVGNTITETVVAGNLYEIGIEAIDASLVSTGVYSIVLTQVGASSSASVTYAEIDTQPVTTGNG